MHHDKNPDSDFKSTISSAEFSGLLRFFFYPNAVSDNKMKNSFLWKSDAEMTPQRLL